MSLRGDEVVGFEEVLQGVVDGAPDAVFAEEGGVLDDLHGEFELAHGGDIGLLVPDDEVGVAGGAGEDVDVEVLHGFGGEGFVEVFEDLFVVWVGGEVLRLMGKDLKEEGIGVGEGSGEKQGEMGLMECVVRAVSRRTDCEGDTLIVIKR